MLFEIQNIQKDEYNYTIWIVISILDCKWVANRYFVDFDSIKTVKTKEKYPFSSESEGNMDILTAIRIGD